MRIGSKPTISRGRGSSVFRLARSGTDSASTRIESLAAVDLMSFVVRLALGVCLALAALALLALPAAAQTLERRLVAADGAAGDTLGISVAVDDDTAVVGAPGDDSRSGAVYVFTRSGDDWTQTARLTASDRVPGEALGTSVAIDGDIIVAGARDVSQGSNLTPGAVYTFERAGGSWTQTARLTSSEGEVGDSLGFSVAIDGDTIVAGAFLEDGGKTDQGSVYTFSRAGAAARTETARLTASNGTANSLLGVSVAIDGDTIVAGAQAADGFDGPQGAAYIFDRAGAAARTETARLTASDGEGGDQFGSSVAIDGDTIVVGARIHDTGGNTFQGAAYTFARTGAATRTETAKLTASDGAAFDTFGTSVAIDDDRVLVGSPADRVGTNNAQGSLYSFARTGDAARTETAVLTASDGGANDRFGASVAMDGGEFVVGAPLDAIGDNEGRGSASIFFPSAASPADLSIEKTGSSDPVTVGDEITYTLSVTNNGPEDATSVEATDALPTDVTFVSASPNCANDAGTVTCDFGVIPTELNETAEIVVTANEPGVASNTATVAAAGVDPNPDNNESTATTQVNDAPFAVLSPNSLDFGETQVGTPSSSRTVTLANTGGADLEASGVSLGGSDPGEFSIASDGCSGESIAPNAAGCEVEVSFSPGSDGDKDAELRFDTNAPGSPHTANLTGTAFRDCTITGTNRSERLLGTPRDDVICALGGNDRIFDRGGNDTIYGDEGNDRIIDRGGNDTMYGDAGRDILLGGSGNDTLFGGGDGDRIIGSSGADEHFGEAGNDILRARDGRRGNDLADGGPERDICSTDLGDTRVGCP